MDKKEYNKQWIKNNRERRAEYYRNYRLTDSGRENTLKAIRKYERNNPEKKNAWNKASRIKKVKCTVCGEGNVHRHHPNYGRPKDVIMLCPKHHKELHSIYKT